MTLSIKTALETAQAALRKSARTLQGALQVSNQNLKATMSYISEVK